MNISDLTSNFNIERQTLIVQISYPTFPLPRGVPASSLSRTLALLGSRDDDELSMITSGQLTKLLCTSQQETSPKAMPEPLTQTSANRQRQP
jgi:hypothetical protein